MKKTFAILSLLFLFGHFAQAQFRKPLTSASSKANSSEAQYIIGLTGGLTQTYWLHSGGTHTKYNQPFNIGITGGLVVERMLNSSTSVSLEGYYSMRNVQLNYEIHNFPESLGLGPDHNKNYYRQLDADFQEVNVQAILTHYLSKSVLRPYVFVGPRVSVPLSGKMTWQKKEILPNQQYNEAGATYDTVVMSTHNMWQFNLGLVVGAGVLYKLNVGNYYFLIKADVSAHAALAYFTFLKGSPYVHASLLNSFTHDEQAGVSENVIGAAYIDPYLLGMRFNTDATAKITLMFPLKKQLQGACIRWGEYD